MLDSVQTPSPGIQPSPLTGVAEGSVVLLRHSDVPEADRQLLVALGMIPDRRLLVRKSGSPWIVEVCGVRIGLSKAIAERLMVEPLDEVDGESPASA